MAFLCCFLAFVFWVFLMYLLGMIGGLLIWKGTSHSSAVRVASEGVNVTVDEATDVILDAYDEE